MNDDLEFMAAAVQLIEDFYPEFLNSSGMTDSPLARVSFYGLMIESTRVTPNYPRKEAVIVVLEMKKQKAHENLRKMFPTNPQ